MSKVAVESKGGRSFRLKVTPDCARFLDLKSSGSGSLEGEKIFGGKSKSKTFFTFYKLETSFTNFLNN
jgi:hypothetical protein